MVCLRPLFLPKANIYWQFAYSERKMRQKSGAGDQLREKKRGLFSIPFIPNVPFPEPSLLEGPPRISKSEKCQPGQ